jgi:hypothetical protein
MDLVGAFGCLAPGSGAPPVLSLRPMFPGAVSISDCERVGCPHSAPPAGSDPRQALLRTPGVIMQQLIPPCTAARVPSSPAKPIQSMSCARRKDRYVNRGSATLRQANKSTNRYSRAGRVARCVGVESGYAARREGQTAAADERREGGQLCGSPAHAASIPYPRASGIAFQRSRA